MYQSWIALNILWGWFTLVGLLGFTSHLSNPIAIAITTVLYAMDSFVPCLSNLMERPRLWLLALICRQKKTNSQDDGAKKWGSGSLKAKLMSHERTNSVTLPASTSLSMAGAVHHVALIVDLGEFLVHFIVQAINNTLIWIWKGERKTCIQQILFMLKCQCLQDCCDYFKTSSKSWKVLYQIQMKEAPWPRSCEWAIQLHSPRPLPRHVHSIMWPMTSWRLSHLSPTRCIIPSLVVHTSSWAKKKRKG